MTDNLVAVLVEDDYGNIIIERKLLELAGIQHCLTFDSGVAALDFIQKQGDSPQRIDVILLDICMPQVDGFMLLKAIRAVPAWATVPVVALTASLLPAQLTKLKQAGFYSLLGKPLNVDRFPDQIRRILVGESVWEIW
ncbi:MAG: response regulator [Thermoflexales bacterium]|nr:response regulator [Thermoflexales bacterium]